MSGRPPNDRERPRQWARALVVVLLAALALLALWAVLLMERG